MLFAAACLAADPVVAAPDGARFRGGAEAGLLLSEHPGGEIGAALAVEFGRALVVLDLTTTRDTQNWNMFAVGLQAGAALSPAADSFYGLAGAQLSTTVQVANDARRGRNDVALTAEGGYAFRHLFERAELWLGLRGLLAVSSHLVASPAPSFPGGEIRARLLF